MPYAYGHAPIIWRLSGGMKSRSFPTPAVDLLMARNKLAACMSGTILLRRHPHTQYAAECLLGNKLQSVSTFASPSVLQELPCASEKEQQRCWSLPAHTLGNSLRWGKQLGIELGPYPCGLGWTEEVPSLDILDATCLRSDYLHSIHPHVGYDLHRERSWGRAGRLRLYP